jgi:PAS domain-containing protein
MVIANTRMPEKDGENALRVQRDGSASDEEKIVHLASFPELDPNPVMELDQEGNLRYLNPATKNIFPNLCTLGVKHPFLVNWVQVIKELRDSNWTKNITREVLAGSSTYEQVISPVSGNHLHIYGRDITRRKQVEEALRESEQMYRSLFESAAEGIIIADIETKELKYANSAICTMLKTHWTTYLLNLTPKHEGKGRCRVFPVEKRTAP